MRWRNCALEIKLVFLQPFRTIQRVNNNYRPKKKKLRCNFCRKKISILFLFLFRMSKDFFDKKLYQKCVSKWTSPKKNHYKDQTKWIQVERLFRGKRKCKIAIWVSSKLFRVDRYRKCTKVPFPRWSVMWQLNENSLLLIRKRACGLSRTMREKKKN